jgi:glycosyltransferase involved in cell wall biosynthesis
MKRIKLLKVVTAFYGGGTEGQVLKLAGSLDRSRFDLQFAGLRKSGDLLKDYEALNVPITEFQIKKLYDPRTFIQIFRFAKFMRNQRMEIVHSYNFYSNVFAIPAARLAHVPLILASIRDQGVYLTPAQKLLQKWVCSLADKILVNAESIQDWLLEQGYQAHKIVLIRNGLDLALYNGKDARNTNEMTRDQKKLRTELKIPESVPLVLMMSRLNPQKGVDDFIKAAAQVKRVHPDAWFLVAGGKLEFPDGIVSEEKQYLQGLRQLAQQLGVGDRLVFAGHRTDTPDVLANATVSVLPSYSEGLSNSLIESMAAGVPVVATNVGGNPELIKEGVNGMLVPPRAPEQLAQAIVQLLDNPDLAREYGRQGKRIACEHYSLETMTTNTQDFYDSELRENHDYYRNHQ